MFLFASRNVILAGQYLIAFPVDWNLDFDLEATWLAGQSVRGIPRAKHVKVVMNKKNNKEQYDNRATDVSVL